MVESGAVAPGGQVLSDESDPKRPVLYREFIARAVGPLSAADRDAHLTNHVVKMCKEQVDNDLLVVRVCYVLCNYFLSRDCYKSKVLQSENYDKFMNNSLGVDGIAPDNYAQKIALLSDNLFSVRNAKHFDYMLSRLDNVDFESAFYELDCAAFFADRGYDIEFNQPNLHQGRSVDFKAIKSDQALNVEVTHVKWGPFSPKSLLNTLRNKRKQIKTDGPGVIFVEIDPSWRQFEYYIWRINNTVSTFLNGTKRVNAVVLSWPFDRKVGEYSMFGIKYFPILNTNCRHYHSEKYAPIMDQSFETLQVKRLTTESGKIDYGESYAFFRYFEKEICSSIAGPGPDQARAISFLSSDRAGAARQPVSPGSPMSTDTSSP